MSILAIIIASIATAQTGVLATANHNGGKRYCDLLSSDQTQLCVVSNPEITPFFGTEFHDPDHTDAGDHVYLTADDATVTLTFDGQIAIKATFTCQSDVVEFVASDFSEASPDKRWFCDAINSWVDLFYGSDGIEIRGLYYGSNKAYGGLCYNTATCSFSSPSTAAPPNFKLPQPPTIVTPIGGFCPVVSNWTCEIVDDPFVVPFNSLEFDLGLGTYTALESSDMNVTFITLDDGNGWTLVDSVDLVCSGQESVTVRSGNNFVPSSGFTTDFFWVCGTIGYVHVILDTTWFNKLGIKSLAYYGNHALSGICFGKQDGTCTKVKTTTTSLTTTTTTTTVLNTATTTTIKIATSTAAVTSATTTTLKTSGISSTISTIKYTPPSLTSTTWTTIKTTPASATTIPATNTLLSSTAIYKPPTVTSSAVTSTQTSTPTFTASTLPPAANTPFTSTAGVYTAPSASSPTPAAKTSVNTIATTTTTAKNLFSDAVGSSSFGVAAVVAGVIVLVLV